MVWDVHSLHYFFESSKNFSWSESLKYYKVQKKFTNDVKESGFSLHRQSFVYNIKVAKNII